MQGMQPLGSTTAGPKGRCSVIGAFLPHIDHRLPIPGNQPRNNVSRAPGSGYGFAMRPVGPRRPGAPRCPRVSMPSGEIDFILKCVAPDLRTFQAFIAELTGAPNVRNVKTSLTLKNSKDAPIVPLELGHSA